MIPTGKLSLTISFLVDSTKFRVSIMLLHSEKFTVKLFKYFYWTLFRLAWTVSGTVTSHPVLRQDRLYPEPASNINASNIDDTELTLSWKAPQGDWSSFEVGFENHFILSHKLILNLYFSWSTLTIIIDWSRSRHQKRLFSSATCDRIAITPLQFTLARATTVPLSIAFLYQWAPLSAHANRSQRK